MPVSLDFLLVGSLSHFILGRIQKPFPDYEKVEDFEDDNEVTTIIRGKIMVK